MNLNYTEPIRNKKTIRNILIYLKNKNDRDYMMFLMGIHTGLRISDLLRLRVRDVKDKSHITLIEKKTKNQRKILINKELKMELKDYLQGKSHYEYLFQSREGGNNPISRIRAYQILYELGDIFGLHISCHTLRKTFGYIHYKNNNDVVYLMEIFNHATPKITLRYIGVMQDELDRSTADMSFL